MLFTNGQRVISLFITFCISYSKSLATKKELRALQIGYFDKALISYGKSLTMKKELGALQNEIAYTHDSIANVYSAQGEHLMALNKHMESLELKKDYHRPVVNTFDIALSFHNIGCEFRHLKKHHEAGKFLREAVSIRKILFRGGIHPEVSRSLWLLGLNYWNLNELEKAKNNLHEALDIIQK